MFKAFCSRCGSPLYARSSHDPNDIRVRLGGFEGDLDVNITGHVWTGSKSTWYAIEDSIPCYLEAIIPSQNQPFGRAADYEPDRSAMKIDYHCNVAPIANGLADELISLSVEVFGSGDRTDGTWRLENMPDLSFFEARFDGALVGFKLGYAVTSQRYYSWLGGVAPSFRRLGIARELMNRQHEWIESRGFKTVETEAVQDNHAMAQLNTDFGFVAAGMKFAGDNSKIIYRKSFEIE